MPYDIKNLQSKVKNLNLLIVDDEKDVLDKLYEFMHKFFTNTDTANSGKEAIECFNNKKYDVLVSDINMPTMNGIDMIKKLRESNKDIFIALMSGSDDIKEENLCDIYLSKPISMENMLMFLSKVAEKKA